MNPIYLELPPLSKGCIRSKKSSQEQPGQDYFERRRRRRLVKLILIQGVKSDLSRQLASVRGRLGLDQGLQKEPETALERLTLLKSNLKIDAELNLRCLIEMRRRN